MGVDDEFNGRSRTPSPLPAVHESQLPREHSLFRPRHSRRQRTALTAAVVFFCTPLVLLGVGVRPAEFENRKLAEFPSISSGFGFFTGLDAWAADHTPLRDKAVAVANGVSRGVFGESPQAPRSKQQDVGGPIPVPPKDPSADRPDPTAYVRAIEGKDDWLYLGFDVEAGCEPNLPLPEMFGRLVRLRQGVEASGRKFVLVVAPNKSTVVPEHMPARYFGKTCFEQARTEFWNQVGPLTGAVDLRPGLAEAAREAGRPVYSKHDSHWTHEGGVVMARAIADAVQPGLSDDWEVEHGGKVQLPADLSKLLGRTDSVELDAYRIKPDGESVRSKPVKGDPAAAQQVTQDLVPGMSNARVGLLGDSFSFYVAQYLVAGFSDITLQHSDAVNSEPLQVAQMLARQDVVVLEVAERNLVGGINPLLNPSVIDLIAAELAKHPR
ncbi:alginate O-acetyltransferase AlgX-related protein [Saccharothrix hoggarensis]|uniref:AlgX/AlgJ SGNH hydrolase-like domain-containing protein n=1 Tax=Saccharothrix hoggarensis TaxID=913853 RepID=A0ABW3QZG1_9PSEU